METKVLVFASLLIVFWYTMPVYRGTTCEEWTSRMCFGIKRLLIERDKRAARRKRRANRVSRYRPRG